MFKVPHTMPHFLLTQILPHTDLRRNLVHLQAGHG